MPYVSKNKSSDAGFYVHKQIVASDTWTVNHDLGRKPSVTVYDSSNKVIMAEVEYSGDQSLYIRFNKALEGAAYLV